MLYRTYLGPFKKGKVNLTYFKGEIKRGQKIRVTPDEAVAMDMLPKQWRGPDEIKEVPIKSAVSPNAETVITVKRTRKTKRKRRKGGK